jgi:hypothetical protein
MRVRTTIAGTARSVRLTAIGWGALAIIASVVISGCTSASSTTTPAIFTPSVTVSGSASVTITASGTAGVSPSSGDSPSPVVTTTTTTPPATPTRTTTATATPTPTITRTVTSYPTAAPVTGGGGTAGFQGALLLVAAIAAILAGAVGIAYRRRLRRR